MKDMHNSIKVIHAITPQAVGTSGAANGKLSAIVDRQGFESVEYVYSAGTSASATDTINPVVLEADATGDSFTSVADGDLLGAESAITLSAAATKKVGYKGSKRYSRLRLYGLGTATAIVSAVAVLGDAADAPVA